MLLVKEETSRTAERIYRICIKGYLRGSFQFLDDFLGGKINLV